MVEQHHFDQPFRSEQNLLPDGYRYACYGQDNQILEVELQPGETVHTENGAMSFMSHGITMDTGPGKKRGPFKLLKRAVAGEDLLINIFKNSDGQTQRVGISPKQPSHVLPIYLDASRPDIICHPGAYLAGHPNVHVSFAFNSVKAAFFGQSGFLMQKMTGVGQFFLACNGAIRERQLAPGETWRAELDAIAAFEDSVKYDTAMVRGFFNLLFGGEKIFMLTLEGPGTIWLQSASQFKVAETHIKSLLRKEAKLLRQ